MSVRIINDLVEEHACLFDSVTDTAFGPVFYGTDALEKARHFQVWLEKDARRYDAAELRLLYNEWVEECLDPVTEELTETAEAQLEGVWET